MPLYIYMCVCSGVIMERFVNSLLPYVSRVSVSLHCGQRKKGCGHLTVRVIPASGASTSGERLVESIESARKYVLTRCSFESTVLAGDVVCTSCRYNNAVKEKHQRVSMPSLAIAIQPVYICTHTNMCYIEDPPPPSKGDGDTTSCFRGSDTHEAA